MSKTGVPREFAKVWEGDSSDTWIDPEDNKNLNNGSAPVKRTRVGGSPETRLAQYGESLSMLGLLPGSRPGKGVGEGMAPPIRTAADLIDQAGLKAKEYVYTSHNRLRPVPPMRACMQDVVDGGNRTEYAPFVSDLNWSVEDRIRLNIPTDPPPDVSGGLSRVHFRKTVSAREFMENTPMTFQTVDTVPMEQSANWKTFVSSSDDK